MRSTVSFTLNTTAYPYFLWRLVFCLYVLKPAGRQDSKKSDFIKCALYVFYECSVYLWDQKCWGQLGLVDSTLQFTISQQTSHLILLLKGMMTSGSTSIHFPRLFRLDDTRTCWYLKHSPPLLHGLHVSLQNKLASAAGPWMSDLADV